MAALQHMQRAALPQGFQDQQRRAARAVAANRDEFFSRPSAGLDWWSPEDGAPAILGGRDLQSGGTWLGLTRAGRIALVTNVRDPANQNSRAPSRGEIVPAWLSGQTSVEDWPNHLATCGYNGVNLLAADLSRGPGWHWMSNRAMAPRGLGPGLYGLSNAALDTSWPKVERLKQQVRRALDEAASVEALADTLFASLHDAQPATDDRLPRTGVSLEWERWLSPVFIRTPDGR